MLRQPGRAPAQFTPSHQTAAPQILKESYFAGDSRQQCVVDVEQRGDGHVDRPFSDIIKRGGEDLVTLHNVGGPSEYEPPDSTGATMD